MVSHPHIRQEDELLCESEGDAASGTGIGFIVVSFAGSAVFVRNIVNTRLIIIKNIAVRTAIFGANDLDFCVSSARLNACAAILEVSNNTIRSFLMIYVFCLLVSDYNIKSQQNENM